MGVKKALLAGLGLSLVCIAWPAGLFAQNESKTPEAAGAKAPPVRTEKEVVVTASKIEAEGPFLPDVEGTRINEGKKTSDVLLEEQPAISNNNYRQALAKTPGLLLSEESTPLVSIGYRGLEPHRAQFMQLLKDGIPIHADMFGYPEAYYTPILQTVDRMEFIHGGAGLMYGPQPGGALNYVTKMPVTDKKMEVHSENIFGADSFFSTYEALTGTVGPVGYLGYIHERQGDGFRQSNSDFEVISGGMKVTLNQTSDSRLTLNYDEYHEEHGEPGGLSLTTRANPTYESNRDFTTRRYDRFRLERYAGNILYEKDFGESASLDLRVYGGSYRRYSKRQRGGGFGTLPAGANANTNDIEEQDFYNFGFEPRLRKDYGLLGGNHVLTIGTHTFFSQSPRSDQRGASAWADSGTLRKRSDRTNHYFSVFAENLFRVGRLAIVPAVRLEHIWQRINESINADKTRVALANERAFDFVPLFGGGVVYELFKGIEAYTNISQSYRPKIFSQAVPLGTNEVVNEDLKEGEAVQYDFGLRGKPLPFFYWDIDYFLMQFKDQIGTVGNTVKNIGNTRTHGMEFTTEADIIGAWDYAKKSEHGKQFGSLSPFVTLTLLDANIESGSNEGRRPQYTPQYNVRTGVRYDWRDRVKVALTGTFVDDHFADDAGTTNRHIPSYKVWDLTAEVNLLQNVYGAFDFSLMGGINNLFDENYYARVRSDGIDPAYRRNIYGGIKIRI